jgi:hypothetical protein
VPGAARAQVGPGEHDAAALARAPAAGDERDNMQGGQALSDVGQFGDDHVASAGLRGRPLRVRDIGAGAGDIERQLLVRFGTTHFTSVQVFAVGR